LGRFWRREGRKMFTLHHRLQADTIEIAQLSLSDALLMNDSSFPWLILVPMREGVREIHDLSVDDRAVLMDEIAVASKTVQKLFGADKINIGALGNIVPQLHVHVIGRFKTDRAWPGPVWGAGAAVPYSQEELDRTLALLRKALKEEFPF